MIDFIKNNKFIAGSAFIVLILIAIIIFFFFIGGNNKQNNHKENNPFANTDTDRELPENVKNSFLFGTSSERFVSENTENTPSPEFRAITKDPVAGAVVTKSTENEIKKQKVRYSTLKDGHILETSLSTISKEDILSNKPILNLINNIWSLNGNTTLLQYFGENYEQPFSYIGNFDLGTSSQNKLVNAHHLEENIISSAISPKGTSIFYLVKTDTGSLGYIEKVKTREKTLIWKSLLTSLNVSWDSPGKILVYTKPTSITNGIVWILNPQTGKTNTVLTKEYALSPKINYLGDKILYSSEETKNGVFSLKIKNIETGENITLPLSTIAEKCTWGTGNSQYVYCAVPKDSMVGEFLEDWYMGVKNTNDELWRIDSNTNNVNQLFDPFKETEEKFDIEKLIVSPEEDYLLFKTRVNNILWSLKLPEATTEIE